MKKANRNEQALAVQKPALEKVDSRAVAMKKKTSEQVVDEVLETACKVTGTRSLDAADRFIVQAGSALVWPKPKDTDDYLVRASAVIAEMAPKNATETMLAVLMIATNDAALMFLKRATLENQYPEAIDADVLRAARLVRVFTEQLEAMQKQRGKACQQKVTVEYVHVHEGGQAIVGAVSTSGGRGAMLISKQSPHERRLGWLKNGNPPGDLTKVQRCGAKNRRGTPCQCPAMPNGRCRPHGGLSTGAKTPEGIESIRRAVTKHGRYSKQAREERDYCRNLLQQCREMLAIYSSSRPEA